MGHNYFYRYSFNPAASGQSFTEGSATPVDFGDVVLTANQYDAQALPLKHQSVAGRATAKLRWRCTAATYTDGQVVARDTGFDIHHPHVPLPHVQGVANVEELLLAVQLELVEGLGLRLPAEAVELLPMDTNNKAQITPPSRTVRAGPACPRSIGS